MGTFFFIIILVMAIVIMFDINEKLDAMLTAPLKETVFKYFMNFLPYIAAQFAPLFVFIAVIFSHHGWPIAARLLPYSRQA